MEINKEKFRELPQIDRIEFLQLEERIERITKPFLTIILFFYSLFFIAILYINDIWKMMNGGISEINFGVVFGFSFIILIIGIIFDLVLIHRRRESLDEIGERFFEIKLKGKKK